MCRRVRARREPQLAPRLLAQRIDGLAHALGLEVPEGPAVAGALALHLGAEAVDRALAAPQRSACRRPSPRRGCGRARRCSVVPGSRMPQLDDGAERHARLGALRPAPSPAPTAAAAAPGRCAPRRPPRSRDRARCRCQRRPSRLRHRAGRAGAEERIEHDVARIGGGQQHAMQQRLGLLRRMRLAAARRPSAAPAPSRSGTASRSASAGRRSAPSWPRS